MGSFGRAILEHDFIWLCLAVYAGSVLQDFFNSLSRDVILPFLNALLSLNSRFAGDNVSWRGQTFVFGDVMQKTLSVLIAILFIYLLIKALKHV